MEGSEDWIDDVDDVVRKRSLVDTREATNFRDLLIYSSGRVNLSLVSRERGRRIASSARTPRAIDTSIKLKAGPSLLVWMVMMSRRCL
jgi:hypothetical protein